MSLVLLALIDLGSNNRTLVEKARIPTIPQYDEDEDDMQRTGREIYQWMETQAQIYIRPEVRTPYVMRGSFHILADEYPPRVWWHPDFVNRLQEILSDLQHPILDKLVKRQRQPSEIARLFNPAFCAVLLRDAVRNYEVKDSRGMPFSLLFLVPSIVLHKDTRRKLPRSVRTKFYAWITQNPEVKIDFGQRTRSLMDFTKTALDFSLRQGILTPNQDFQHRFVYTGKRFNKIPKPTDVGNINEEEIKDIRQASRLVGRWLAEAGSEQSIYAMWGIRP